MKLTIERKWEKAEYVIGRLYIDGMFICNTLEPTDRGLENKALPNKLTSPEWQAAEKEARKEKNLHVPGTTAIPTGLYTIGQNISKKFHGRRLYLRNVPGFDGIMIHEGNTLRDTAGCILVGENTQRGRVNNSKAWLETVNKMVMTALNNLETVVVRISG